MKYCAKKKKKIMFVVWMGIYTVINLKYNILYNIIYPNLETIRT